MTVTSAGEVSRLDVRVNPRNGDFVPTDPDYVRGQIEDQDRFMQTIAERMRRDIEEGTFSLPTNPGSPGETEDDETALLLTAHRIAQKAMTIRAALGGYGLVGKVDGLVFHGVDLNWIPDEDVAEGEFELEGVENPGATIGYLTTLLP